MLERRNDWTGVDDQGVDMIERTSPTGTVTTGFPIYDAHGNNAGTISRSGNDSYSLADRRTYDAWGAVRSQQSGGDPKLRYCASLGHRQDDESGLVYMRARYYEPTSGRFISEDPAQDGGNWFTYASNKPTAGGDFTGKFTFFDLGIGIQERMRMYGAQASMLAAALSRYGDKIAQTAAAYNFRLAILLEEAMDDVSIKIAGVNPDMSVEMEAERMNPEEWRKMMATFTGSDPQTGNDFVLKIHWLQETSGTQVFDVKIKDFFEK